MPEQPAAPQVPPPSLAERLQDVTEALAAASTPADVFAVVLTPALQALDAIAGAVLLVNEAGDGLEIAATQGYQEGAQTIWHDGSLSGNIPAGDALKKREPLFFELQGDLVRAYPELEERTGAIAPLTNAVLPMFLDERPLGTIVLDFQEPHDFTPEERRFLRTLTAQCAIALGRVRLMTDLQRQVQERVQQIELDARAQEAFVALTELIGSQSDVLILVAQALQVLRARFTDGSGGYYVLEDDVWKLRVWTNDLNDQPELLRVLQAGLPYDTPVFVEIVRTGTPTFVENWDAGREQVEQSETYASSSGYPLVQDGQVKSVLALGRLQEAHWSEQDKAVVRAVGHSLGLALERTEQAQRLATQNVELDARTKVLEGFAELTRDLSVEVDGHTLVKRAQEVVMSLLTEGYALYYERLDGLWRNTVQTGELGPTPSEAAALQAVVDAGFPYDAPQSLVVPWTTRQPFYQDEYLRGGDTDAALVQYVNTVATLPVFVNGEIAGIICFVLFEPRKWTGTDKAVMETVVRSLGLALERAQGVTDLAARTDELARERTFLRAVLESLTEGIVACDPEGRLTLFNEATRTFHGQEASALPPEEWSGQYDLFEGDGVTPLVTERIPLYRAWRGERVRDAEMVIRPEKGEARSIIANGQPIFTENGAPLGAVVAMHDVTARKRAEADLQRRNEELRRSNAELEQFAYVASHDLQEPLRTITSFSQLLAMKYQGRLDEKADLYIRLIGDATTRMGTLLQDLLAFSRVGSSARRRDVVDLRDVLAQVKQDLQAQVERTEAQVSIGPLPSVSGDGTQLRQLFQNLLGNALKFRHPDRTPEVHIHAHDAGDQVKITVRDNGIGIEPEYFDRIFTIFQRLHTRETYEGSGIGLSIARKIVERHGGQIWLESTSGDGTAFHVTLPLAPGGAA
ncbi:ATP-binding protein [Deinococcus peraridilitoris]|uniref:histidine kinase n=1 Tax=Deinococcus peraridilitoris (strain DSM 19664 / LMG 22246 / CIP 109416 / KR-200) TaxID=937777 RepID=L0A875_DEIPD|nr:ATP-binding protein [Deinococcus peraridilitoris]AFZ69609.1 PAS domain S-box [Deinococcus peraridilitoris DSM 19664]